MIEVHLRENHFNKPYLEMKRADADDAQALKQMQAIKGFFTELARKNDLIPSTPASPRHLEIDLLLDGKDKNQGIVANGDMLDYYLEALRKSDLGVISNLEGLTSEFEAAGKTL